ncbi:MAG: FKBP-type peptidyl-prolyl cis-trans isomerase [Flavobacteriales bacterium]
MRNKGIFLFIFSYLLLLLSCKRTDAQQNSDPAWGTAHSVDFNQELSIREDLKIKTFLSHYTYLHMSQTITGLRYMIYEKSNAQTPLAKDGQQALVKLKVSLLDGRVCYQTKPDEIERITIAHSEKESGVHEALQLLRVGDKAKLILPSHLGHGLLGDRLHIPPQSILYIDLQLLDLQ